MELSEKVLEQARVIEESEQGKEVTPDLGAMKELMFESSKELDRLGAELREANEKINALSPIAKIGDERIAEVKEETLRMIKVVCEASESKDMSRHERMTKRFAEEKLDFDAIKRYYEDALDEFNRLFPVEGRAKAKEEETKDSPDLSGFKIKPIK